MIGKFLLVVVIPVFGIWLLIKWVLKSFKKIDTEAIVDERIEQSDLQYDLYKKVKKQDITGMEEEKEVISEYLEKTDN